MFEVYRSRLYGCQVAVQVAFPIRPDKPRKFHLCFTYVSPDVFSVSSKSLTISILQDIVRVSFSAPGASQKCGAFLFVCRLVCPLTIVHVSLVQENIGRTALPCTSLADLTDHPPDSGRLEQKTPSRDVF